MKPEKLEGIVPEYHSKNPLIRGLFYWRIRRAIAISGVLKLSGGSVLDVGCGEGPLLERLHQRRPNIHLVGIDTHADTLSLSGRLPAEIEIYQMSLMETPFERGRFDFLFCLDVLEHIEDLESACLEIRRLLKPGGKLIVSAPTESFFYRLGRFLTKGTWSEIEGPGAGPHLWDAGTLESFLLSHGFQLERKTKIPPLPLFDLFHINNYSPKESFRS
ncbi:MAG: class I SAM-dependent methyltransferase [Armatimonadota bacterium]|nr:class I SAM-dependent methyltransferase [Armatimonadota bacterium]